MIIAGCVLFIGKLSAPKVFIALSLFYFSAMMHEELAVHLKAHIKKRRYYIFAGIVAYAVLMAGVFNLDDNTPHHSNPTPAQYTNNQTVDENDARILCQSYFHEQFISASFHWQETNEETDHTKTLIFTGTGKNAFNAEVPILAICKVNPDGTLKVITK